MLSYTKLMKLRHYNTLLHLSYLKLIKKIYKALNQYSRHIKIETKIETRASIQPRGLCSIVSSVILRKF